MVTLNTPDTLTDALYLPYGALKNRAQCRIIANSLFNIAEAYWGGWVVPSLYSRWPSTVVDNYIQRNGSTNGTHGVVVKSALLRVVDSVDTITTLFMHDLLNLDTHIHFFRMREMVAPIQNQFATLAIDSCLLASCPQLFHSDILTRDLLDEAFPGLTEKALLVQGLFQEPLERYHAMRDTAKATEAQKSSVLLPDDFV